MLRSRRLLLLTVFLVFAIYLLDVSATTHHHRRPRLNSRHAHRHRHSKGHKADQQKKHFIETNRHNDFYEYLSVCRNESASAKNGEPARFYTTRARICQSQVALGRYRNAVNESGWGILEVETFPGFTYEEQAYAAGVAEGALTRLQIYYHYRNTIEDQCKNHTNFCKRLFPYVQANLDWVREQVIATPSSDKYWRHVNVTFAQMTGIYDAYVNRNLTPRIAFDITPITMIQLYGDNFDLTKFFNKTPDPQEYPEAGHCSGFVKLAHDNSDLFFAQVAMSGFNTMNRVLKLYKFAYDSKEVPGRIVSFSGYPAALVSSDDFTLTSAGLGSLETTNAVWNQDLYNPDKYLKAQGQVHSWVRTFISNALANSSKEWTEIFARYNSGTYNNQWVVLDYKKFTPRQPLPDTDVLWILEQIPGYTESADVTWFLKKRTYFPSYNIPYLKKISELSGWPAKAAQFDWFKWGAAPRAKIFERDHDSVQDIDGLTRLMRYNDYTRDPLSRCKCSPLPYTGEAGISARGDLNLPNGTYEVESMGFRNHGGLDFKGTNFEMAKKLRFRAWGGPPYDPLPPFDWSTTKVVANHYGQPTLWNFDYIDLKWEANVGIDFFEQRDSNRD